MDWLTDGRKVKPTVYRMMRKMAATTAMRPRKRYNDAPGVARRPEVAGVPGSAD